MSKRLRWIVIALVLIVSLALLFTRRTRVSTEQPPQVSTATHRDNPELPSRDSDSVALGHSALGQQQPTVRQQFAAVPKPTNSNVLNRAIVGNPVKARAEYNGRIYELTPNSLGIFPRMHVAPKSIINISVSYAGAKAGSRVLAQATDGGALNELRSSAAYQLDENGDWQPYMGAIVYYPDGSYDGFPGTLTTNGVSRFTSGPGQGDYLEIVTNGLDLVTSEGWRYSFARVITAIENNGYTNYVTAYRLDCFYDTQQNRYAVSTDSLNRLTSVTEPGGRYLAITYTDDKITRVDGSDGQYVTYDYEAADSEIPELGENLIQADYLDGTHAYYTYYRNQDWQYSPFVLATARDPRYLGGAAQVRYEYVWDSYSFWYLNYYGDPPYGYLFKEMSYADSRVMATLGTPYSLGRTLTNSDDSVEFFTFYAARPTSRVSPDGTTSYGNEGYGGFLVSKTEGNLQTDYEITARGRWLKATYTDYANYDPVAEDYVKTSESWARDDLDLVLAHTNALGQVTLHTRDERHRITRTDYPDGSYVSVTRSTP